MLLLNVELFLPDSAWFIITLWILVVDQWLFLGNFVSFLPKINFQIIAEIFLKVLIYIHNTNPNQIDNKHIMKRKWSCNNYTNINKTNNHLSSQVIEHNKHIITRGIGNTDPGLGQSQKCGRIKSVNGIPTLPS